MRVKGYDSSGFSCRDPSAGALAAATLVAFLLAPAIALAQVQDEDPCMSSGVEGQILQRKDQLLEAREKFVTCARAQCPSEVIAYCTKWLADVDAHIPSIVVTLRDREGHDLANARVLVDGREVATSLTGRAIDLDPGAHEVRLQGGQWAQKVQNIVLPEGAKLRPVAFEVDLPTSHRATRPAWPAYLIGGVAILGAAGVVGFGVEGLNERSDVCPGGSCPSQGAYGSVKGWYVAADVSLGVAVVAAGLCAYLLLTGGSGGGKEAALGLGRGWTF